MGKCSKNKFSLAEYINATMGISAILKSLDCNWGLYLDYVDKEYPKMDSVKIV